MTLETLTAAILAIVEDYAIYISAAAVFGLAIWAARRLLKGMR